MDARAANCVSRWTGESGWLPSRPPSAPEPSRRSSILYGSPAHVMGMAGLLLGVGFLTHRALKGRQERQRHSYRRLYHPRNVRVERENWRAAASADREAQARPDIAGERRSREDTRRQPAQAGTTNSPATLFFAGSAILAFSGLADSALEHYRGRFENPAMAVAPTISTLALAASTAQTFGRPASGTQRGIYWLSAATGLAGLGFHLFNIGKRTGRFDWLNLFYGAPLMAPGTQVVAGLFGLTGDRLRGSDTQRHDRQERSLPLSPRILAAGTAAALLPTAAEAGLLHYRGAFQNPHMVLPVTLPPLTAAAVVLAVLRRSPNTLAMARTLSCSTAAMGLLGSVFHAYGIHRNMGGWKNWSQMILQGPPLPAPPGFTGVGLAALAALTLMEEENEDRLH